MGSLLFAFGSAAGAALAWLVSRIQPRPSTGLALNGIASVLLGALMSASGISNAAVTDAGLGLLSTAAPLTLCMTRLCAAAGPAGIAAVVRHLAAMLALALASGISCATLGFVAVESVREMSVKQDQVQPVGYPTTMSSNTSHRRMRSSVAAYDVAAVPSFPWARWACLSLPQF